MKTRAILEIEAQAENEGFVLGTKAYEERLVYLKVQKCQEILNTSCSECQHLHFCKLTEQLYRITQARKEKEKNGKPR